MESLLPVSFSLQKSPSRPRVRFAGADSTDAGSARSAVTARPSDHIDFEADHQQSPPGRLPTVLELADAWFAGSTSYPSSSDNGNDYSQVTADEVGRAWHLNEDSDATAGAKNVNASDVADAFLNEDSPATSSHTSAERVHASDVADAFLNEDSPATSSHAGAERVHASDVADAFLNEDSPATSSRAGAEHVHASDVAYAFLSEDSSAPSSNISSEHAHASDVAYAFLDEDSSVTSSPAGAGRANASDVTDAFLSDENSSSTSNESLRANRNDITLTPQYTADDFSFLDESWLPDVDMDEGQDQDEW
jgi:hypothetical protein